MYRFKMLTGIVAVAAMIGLSACDSAGIQGGETEADAPSVAAKGAVTANGWDEGEQIYYIDLGPEKVTERGDNDIYLIGGNRVYQANVVDLVPGERGYSPHWNVKVVHTADGVTTADILASPYASELYESMGVLFDDFQDVLDAEADGLVTIEVPGVVVNCPIVSVAAADAPGNMAASEDFASFPETF